MFAFVRVFVFYVGSAAVLTWGLFALGWADALELEGFSNTPVVEQPRQQPQPVAVVPVAVAPVADPVPKSALPRETRAPVAEPVTPAPAPMVQPKTPVAAPLPPPPLVAPAPPVKVAAIPQPERTPEPMRQADPVRPFPPPVIETRPPPTATAPPVTVSPVTVSPVTVSPVPAAKFTPPVATPPARQVDLAPSVPPAAAPGPLPVPPAARPTPVPPAATQAPASAPSRATIFAPVLRVAGFGHDALVDQLEETRRSRGDVACVVMRELVFKAGTAQLVPKTTGELATVAKVLTLFPERRIEIGSRLGPGRPLASDAKLRADRARIIHASLVSMGVPGDKLVLDPGDAYDRAGDDLTRAGASRMQSIGLCVRDS